MIEWNKVTWYSRVGTYAFFLGFVPVLAIVIGANYGMTMLTIKNAEILASSEFVAAPIHNTAIATSTRKEILVMQKSIVGVWKSTEDSKYVVTFAKGGAFKEEYRDEEFKDDAVVDTGSWKILTEFDLADLQLPTDFSQGEFLKKVFADGHQFNYKIVTVSTSTLELRYLNSGKMSVFERIK